MGWNPSSRRAAFTTGRSSARARICAPRQTPRNGTPASTASRVSVRSSSRNGCRSTWSALTVPPSITTPATSESSGSGCSSNASFRTRTSGFIAPSVPAALGLLPLREGSAALEVPSQLPVGHRGVVEDDLLLLGRVQQVLEDEVAERLPGHLALAERIAGMVQRRGNPRHVLGLVC